MILPPALMWIDPGLVTGVALLRDREMFWSAEAGFMEAGTWIENLCSSQGQHCWVGWESFRIHPHTPPADAHHAIEMIGVTRRYATRYCCKILTPASPASPSALDQRLMKALGWWKPGFKDANSAAAHLLRFMMVSNAMPPHVQEVVLAHAQR